MKYYFFQLTSLDKLNHRLGHLTKLELKLIEIISLNKLW